MDATSDHGERSDPTQSPHEPHEQSIERNSFDTLVNRLSVLFRQPFEQTEQVEAICSELRQLLSETRTELDEDRMLKLTALLYERGGPMARPVFDLLAGAVPESTDPWPLLAGMLAAADVDLVGQTIGLVLQSARSGSLVVDNRVVSLLADRIESEESLAGQSTHLETILEILRHKSSVGSQSCADLLRDLYTSGETAEQRSLAARLLDLDGRPAPSELAKAIVGAENHRTLAPYLAYTRATHLDLLHLSSASTLSSATVPSLRRARTICGEALLRRVIAELGWPSVNFGVEVRPYVGIRVNGSLPLMVTPTEASVVPAGGNQRPAHEVFLFVAHGGVSHLSAARDSGEDQVARFRATNLAHAELLGFILDLAPLTRERVQDILGRMDRIVGDFTALFSAHSDECAILPELYRELRGRVVAELEREADRPQLSPELSRLVQMFEDPRSLGEVHTMHGLKRYLHQRGLKLGFQLVGRMRATNRTVDLVLASRRRLHTTARRIRYIDFETNSDGSNPVAGIPYPVSVVADGFARQLLYGQESFPQVDVYCYGNEVHYYLSFRNHPAFLRIDYSPPLRGGMIDLEYYGVSKYELPQHPDTSLKAIELFFRRLEFDVQLDNTRIHARYDKERALNLGQLCRKADAIFRLVPYLMDIDWIIGSLNLRPEARRVVAEAWSESFVRWGVLPLRELLTKDKTGIRIAAQSPVEADGQIVWSGDAPYTDRFNAPAAADFYEGVLAQLQAAGLGFLLPLGLGESRVLGQLDLERLVLDPLHEALGRGEIVETPEGYKARGADLFRREHEAERFAEILTSQDEIPAATRLAELVAPLERTLRFRTTGSINGYEVQRGELALRGQTISICVLRDVRGLIRLALFADDRILCRWRDGVGEKWRSNGSCDPVQLATLLLRNNYLASGLEPAAEDGESRKRAVVASFRMSNPSRRRLALPNERIINGLRAAPGRAVGRVVLGTANRTPEDCFGAVLIAPTVGPSDSPVLHQCVGVVSTGGGILSHAALIAAQFRKPALVIQGKWQTAADASLSLLYRITEFVEEEKTIGGYQVSLYRNLHETEHALEDGDLVVLDANEGTLSVLGQGRETVALHEGIKRFGEASRPLGQTQDAREMLILRGRLLQAGHMIEKLLGRLTDPSLAHYALYELLLGENFSVRDSDGGERIRLLSLLLANPQIGTIVRDHLLEIAEDLRGRCQSAGDESLSLIPAAQTPYEILLLRLQALRLGRICENVSISLRGCGMAAPDERACDATAIDAVARERLMTLRAHDVEKVISAPERNMHLRHLTRQIDRLDLVLGAPSADQDAWEKHRTRMQEEDHGRRCLLDHRLTLTSTDGGLELSPLVGLKAANLAEVEQLGGSGLVPAWFVVTDRAFREMLQTRAGQALAGIDTVSHPDATLHDVISAILASPGLDYEERSLQIRHVWQKAALPGTLTNELSMAYERLAAEDSVAGNERPDASLPFVAIRSSTREEDAEAAARAGEFDTFLFVQGTEALREFLRLAWSGLWTARAIQNRAILGTDPTETGGGVIVQRMVRSRVSGVLHTVNMATGESREIVINAGLGLGEGIVSGEVPSDDIVVAKEGVLEGAPLRFRYTTADKRAQVVFDARAGQGTRLVESLYHQRFRPALEYVELCELVRTALRLEAAYGYPLDIEFGIEGTKLWILQVRPVPVYLAVLQETLENWPLDRPKTPGSEGQTAEIAQ